MITITTSDFRATETAVAGYARTDYLALFRDAGAAVEFENQALSIGRELLPECARAVLDGREADSDYYAWLADQAVAAGAAESAAASNPLEPLRAAAAAELGAELELERAEGGGSRLRDGGAVSVFVLRPSSAGRYLVDGEECSLEDAVRRVVRGPWERSLF